MIEIPTPPKWMHEVAPDSCVDIKDLCQWLNITYGGMQSRIKTGIFPKPDWVCKCSRGVRKGKWRIKTVLTWYKGLNK